MRSDTWVARCTDVVRTYRTGTGEVRALKGVSADFPSAMATAVVGPSGSGKSTLLALLSGMDRPTAGSVEVAGTMISSIAAPRLRRLRRHTVGHVFQRPSDNFLPHLTVSEHIRMAAGSARSSAAIDPMELLAKLDVGHRLEHLPSQLSGGEQQRVALAQVIAAGARIIVADEPTAELDTASAGSLVEAVRRLTELGLTFVVATHDPALRRMAQHVLELEHGRVRARPPGVRGPAARSRRSAWRGLQAPPAPAVDPTEHRPPPPGGDPVLHVRGVVKSYRRGTEVVHALREVNLSVGPGEVVGIVGRSGSGKTTLLNVIAGWESPDAGGVAGPMAGSEPAPPWSEVAIVPQRLGLLAELTVRANVEYPARVAGTLDDHLGRAEELLETLGLAELADRYPPETSVGEQQRAALARALILSPRLLLADEPTGHQDEGWEDQILVALRAAAAVGTSSLVATHDERVAGGCDRTVRIADGRIADGKISDG